MLLNIVMVKGTNATGKSHYPVRLRKNGWGERVVERIFRGYKVVYTKFTKKGRVPIYVLGKYSAKGSGGCDGLKKDEMFATITFLWHLPGHIYFEGQNISDTLTTHIMWMLHMNQERPSMRTRGTLPLELLKTLGRKRSKARRRIKIVCLTADIETILKRLKKRTPGKVLKRNAKKTRQKHESVLRQYESMKAWPELMRDKMELVYDDNTDKTPRQSFNFMHRVVTRDGRMGRVDAGGKAL